MTEATLFSFFNVGVGFCISWLLSHYAVPLFFGLPRNAGRATSITVLFTIAALIRNMGVYLIWVTWTTH